MFESKQKVVYLFHFHSFFLKYAYHSHFTVHMSIYTWLTKQYGKKLTYLYFRVICTLFLIEAACYKVTTWNCNAIYEFMCQFFQNKKAPWVFGVLK